LFFFFCCSNPDSEYGAGLDPSGILVKIQIQILFSPSFFIFAFVYYFIFLNLYFIYLVFQAEAEKRAVCNIKFQKFEGGKGVGKKM
jgi:hypothetical protein